LVEKFWFRMTALSPVIVVRSSVQKPATSARRDSARIDRPGPLGTAPEQYHTDPESEGPKKHPRPGKKGPQQRYGVPVSGLPVLRYDKGKGDVDESFNEAAAVSFRARHQRRGVRHHDRDPAPRIEVRPGLLGCNRTKNCFSGSECGGRSAKHVDCRKAMR
jgi:hypothetical protein